MGKKLYVGNLGYGVTDSDLVKLFEAHGTVESAQVVMDRDTGRPARRRPLRLRRNRRHQLRRA
jgi:RNA recognition motif-containing protein